MAANLTETAHVVLVRAQRCIYALALEDVVETMRPLPVESVPGVPPFVWGVAIIRGEPVPVVDLGTLFQGPDTSSPQRLVLLRTDRRLVALAVDEVLGVYPLEQSFQQGLPPLLQNANAELVAAVGVRDRQLLLVLQAARLVPDEVWRALASREGQS